jgi:hypothetical protein
MSSSPLLTVLAHYIFRYCSRDTTQRLPLEIVVTQPVPRNRSFQAADRMPSGYHYMGSTNSSVLDIGTSSACRAWQYCRSLSFPIEKRRHSPESQQETAQCKEYSHAEMKADSEGNIAHWRAREGRDLGMSNETNSGHLVLLSFSILFASGHNPKNDILDNDRLNSSVTESPIPTF